MQYIGRQELIKRCLSWCEVDSEGTRYLLCDSFGRLSLLYFNRESPGLELLFLGDVCIPFNSSNLYPILL